MLHVDPPSPDDAKRPPVDDDECYRRCFERLSMKRRLSDAKRSEIVGFIAETVQRIRENDFIEHLTAVTHLSVLGSAMLKRRTVFPPETVGHAIGIAENIKRSRDVLSNSCLARFLVDCLISNRQRVSSYNMSKSPHLIANMLGGCEFGNLNKQSRLDCRVRNIASLGIVIPRMRNANHRLLPLFEENLRGIPSDLSEGQKHDLAMLADALTSLSYVYTLDKSAYDFFENHPEEWGRRILEFSEVLLDRGDNATVCNSVATGLREVAIHGTSRQVELAHGLILKLSGKVIERPTGKSYANVCYVLKELVHNGEDRRRQEAVEKIEKLVKGFPTDYNSNSRYFMLLVKSLYSVYWRTKKKATQKQMFDFAERALNAKIRRPLDLLTIASCLDKLQQADESVYDSLRSYNQGLLNEISPDSLAHCSKRFQNLYLTIQNSL